MANDEYLKYIKGTIDGYPKKIVKHIKDKFVEVGIAQDETQVNINNILEDGIDVNGLEIVDKVKKCIDKNKSAIKCFEKWEFVKDYKYSVVFLADNFNNLLLKASTIESLTDMDFNESDFLFNTLTSPIRYSSEELEILKFNLKYKANDPFSDKRLYLKYPVLLVLHKKEQLVEIRFDILKRIFIPERKGTTLYVDLIAELREVILDKMSCKLTPLDLNYIIAEAKREDQDEVRLMAQSMNLPGGGNAQLNVGKNENYVLPLIGELKELLLENLEELTKVPVLKTALDQFVYENESLSDYPWIELMWENEIKSKSIRIKIIYNYRNTSYCLIQHYYSNGLVGMGRMNHVIRYINKYRVDTKRKD